MYTLRVMQTHKACVALLPSAVLQSRFRVSLLHTVFLLVCRTLCLIHCCTHCFTLWHTLPRTVFLLESLFLAHCVSHGTLCITHCPAHNIRCERSERSLSHRVTWPHTVLLPESLCLTRCLTHCCTVTLRFS